MSSEAPQPPNRRENSPHRDGTPPKRGTVAGDGLERPERYCGMIADVSGKQGMVSNVLVSWMGHSVFLVAGLIMPRLIDRQLGQTLLGVWDFAWSLIAYFGLVQLGLGGSVGRYVARYRAKGDAAGVSQAVSSAAGVLAGMAMLVVIMTIVTVYWLLPRWTASQLGSDLVTAQWVVLFLGIEVAVQIFFSCYTGVLTGCHLWRTYYLIQSSAYGLSVFAMILALMLGGGLRSLALLHCGGALAGFGAITLASYRAVADLRVRWNLASWREARDMFTFGTKSFVPQMGELLLNQSVSLLLLTYLGPIALALYSRPRSLVQHTRTLVTKMSGVLIPSASSLHSIGCADEVRGIAIKGTRYAAYLTLPVASLVGVMGGPILEVWMGPDYRTDLIPMMLSIGSAAMIILTPALSVLVGMNLHAAPGRVHFLGCVATALAVWLGLAVLDLGVVGAAACASIPLTLIYTIYMPAYIARHVRLPLRRFLRESLMGPILSAGALGACLLGSRCLFSGTPLIGLTVGCVLGAGVMMPLYWHHALPSSLKPRLLSTAKAFLMRNRTQPYV